MNKSVRQLCLHFRQIDCPTHSTQANLWAPPAVSFMALHATQAPSAHFGSR